MYPKLKQGFSKRLSFVDFRSDYAEADIGKTLLEEQTRAASWVR